MWWYKINRVQIYFFNALLLSAVGILIRAVSVSFNIYVSSKVGAEGMGLLTLTTTVYGFAITFATSGINLAVVRLISGAVPYTDKSIYFDKETSKKIRKIMINAVVYCLIFSVTASIVLFSSASNIGIHLMNDKRTVPSLRFLALSLVPISMSSVLNGYFYAVRRVYKTVIVQVCEQGAKISVVTFLLLTIGPSGLEYACLAVVGGGAISEAVCVLVSAILYFFDRKKHKSINIDNVENGAIKAKNYINSSGFPFQFKESNHNPADTDGFSKIFSIAFPIAISSYVRSALLTIEHLAIPWGLKQSGASASSALASYGVLHGMVFPILLFPQAVLRAFSSLLIPELSSSQSQGDERRIKYIVSRVFAITLLFSIGVAGLFICFSYEIGYYLYGNTEAAKFIKMISPLIPLMYLDGAVDSMLKGLGEQLYTMKVNIADSLISVLLVIVLLPSMGINGYVIVIFITELFNTSFSILKLLNVTKVRTPVLKWVIKPLLCVIASTTLTRILFDLNILSGISNLTMTGKPLLFAEICLTSFFYIVTIRIIGAVSKDDVMWAKSIMKK